MKKHYAYYSLAFVASLLIHFSTMEGFFRYAPVQEVPKPRPIARQQVNMQFMDAYKQQEQPPPPDPTPLIGTDNNIAAQPELPDEPVESQNQPYMKKTSESKQIRTQPVKPSVPQPPQVLTQSSQPQTEQLDSTDHTEVQKEIKNIVKEDVFEKKRYRSQEERNPTGKKNHRNT